MVLAFDSARSLRQADFPDLVEAVVSATPNEESDWLEWKSTLDLSTKAAHSHIARAVLGFANRMPDDVAGVVGGCGYLLVGVEPGRVTGVTQVDPVELDRGVCAYTGTTDGPRWRSYYHTDASGRSVLIVEVAPPAAGDPMFAARKEGEKVTDGLILVRRAGGNRQATSAELALLAQRAVRRTATLAIAVSAPDGATVTLADAGPDAQALWLKARQRDAMKSLEQHRAKTPDLPIVLSSRNQPSGEMAEAVAHLDDAAAGLSAVGIWIAENQRALQAMADTFATVFETVPEKRTEQEYEREVDGYVDAAREALSFVLPSAAGKAVSPIRIRLQNPGHSTLAAVVVTAVVRGAVAVLPGRGYALHELPAPPQPFGPRQKPTNWFPDIYLPHVAEFNAYPAMVAAPRRLRPEIEVRDDGAVAVEFPPVELRAAADVALDALVILAIAPRSEPVTVEWSATSGNVDGVARGRLVLPVNQAVISLDDLLEAGRE